MHRVLRIDIKPPGATFHATSPTHSVEIYWKISRHHSNYSSPSNYPTPTSFLSNVFVKGHWTTFCITHLTLGKCFLDILEVLYLWPNLMSHNVTKAITVVSEPNYPVSTSHPTHLIYSRDEGRGGTPYFPLFLCLDGRGEGTVCRYRNADVGRQRRPRIVIRRRGRLQECKIWTAKA